MTDDDKNNIKSIVDELSVFMAKYKDKMPSFLIASALLLSGSSEIIKMFGKVAGTEMINKLVNDYSEQSNEVSG